VLTVEKVRVEFPVRVNNDVMEDAVRVLTNNVEKFPSYPFNVEYAFNVETPMVHAVRVLSCIVDNNAAFPKIFTVEI